MSPESVQGKFQLLLKFNLLSLEHNKLNGALTKDLFLKCIPESKQSLGII